MNKVFTFVVALVFLSQAWAMPLIPDAGLTPGALCDESDSQFEGYRHHEQIPVCDRSVNRGKRRRVFDAYQIPDNERHNYTIDHFIPLSIGGNNSELNLWPEHVAIKRLRPDLEQDIFNAMARGEVTQKDAVEFIRSQKMAPPFTVEQVKREEAHYYRH